MNVFVLCTGRCGSNTFTQACSHIHNYSAAHESRTYRVGTERLNYPDNHIEADNRLSWFLGRLDKKYGSDPFYVHLRRNKQDTAASFLKRYEREAGIIKAYAQQILWRHADDPEPLPEDQDPMGICLDYCETVNANIEVFLEDKPRTMEFRLERAQEDYAVFWERIGAEGHFERALAEWEMTYNETKPSLVARIKSKLQAATKRLPLAGL